MIYLMICSPFNKYLAVKKVHVTVNSGIGNAIFKWVVQPKFVFY